MTEEQKAARREQMRLYHKKRRAEHPEYYREYERSRARTGDADHLAKRRAKYAADPETSKAKMREWYANPENRARQAEYNKARYATDPTIVRRYKLKQEYGMTLDDFEAMRAAQNGACAICTEPFTNTPHVDHCHATGAVRALLCAGCNTGLGRFRDNPERMEAAAAYIRAHRSRLTLVKEA